MIKVIKPKPKVHQPDSAPFTNHEATSPFQFTLAQSLFATSILLVYAAVAYAFAKQLIK